LQPLVCGGNFVNAVLCEGGAWGGRGGGMVVM